MWRPLDIAFARNRLVRQGLIGFVLAIFVATITSLVLDVRRQMATLATASSDNVQWVLTQAETELQRLRLSALPDPSGDAADLDEIRLRFDIFYSRVQTLANSAVFDEMRADAKVRGNLSAMQRFLEDWIPLIDGPDEALLAALPELAQGTADIHGTTRAVALEGIEFFSRVSDRQRASVSNTLFNIAVLTIALVGLLIVVAIAMMRLARAREHDAMENRLIRERMETIISTSLDAVVVTNRQGEIEEYNGAAERVFGYARAEAIGAPMAELIIPDHFRKGHEAGMKRYLEDGTYRVIDHGIVQLEAKRRDGSTFPVDFSLARANSPTGEIFIGFVRDISDRVRAERNLKDARDRAIDGEKKKAELLAVMSHEMRTPLNGILGTLELIETAPLDDETRRLLSIIGQSGKLLLGHVNDVLDISRLDAGKMSMHKTGFDLVKLLQEITESQAIPAERNGNRLLLTPPSPALHEVYSDPDRIRQILLNLVSNAIKFTRDGTITLEAECHNGLREVELRVIDTGVGIAEEDLERIFGDFVTVDSSYSRKAGGTGLGLGISQRLASALGGELGAESEPGDGSLFWVRLPMAAPANARREFAPAPSAPEPPDASMLAPLDILVVEDNAINRMVVRKMLETAGHRVSEAHDGAEGVARASEGNFDLILMDISMPEMDGVTATQKIRESGANLPIIATTAHAMPDEVARFRAAGMNDVLVKPISRVGLLTMLAKIAGPHDPPRPATTEGPALFDRAHFDDMVREFSADQVARMFDMLTSEMSAFVALPLGRSAEARASLAEKAHRMAGSTGVFGAHRLAALLRDLQVHAPDDTPEALAGRRRKVAACWVQSSRAIAAACSEQVSGGPV